MRRKLWTVATSSFVIGVAVTIAGIWTDERLAMTGAVFLGVALVFALAADLSDDR